MGSMKPGNQKFRSCTTLKQHNMNAANTGTQEPKTKTQEPHPQVQFIPWAFARGKEAGLKEDRTRRGLMYFGLGCAAAAVDALNTKNWLNGFAIGLRARPTAVGHPTFLQA
jgi:hypothetical protein